jgi:acyl carrier protein
MAVDTEVPWDMQEQRARSLNFGISPDEGKEAFSRVLNSSIPQVLVLTQDMATVIEERKSIQRFSTAEKVQKASSDESMHPRPTLSSVYIAPGNEAEQTVAEIWRQLLRIEKVGIHDNFVELGGHSLLATQVVARLRKAFPIEFSVASIFENPTVHSLSKMIIERENRPPSFEDSKRRGQRRKERKLQRMMM